ncbi:uncharacterized protein [Rutidosis leptorrhynchoides]|uniref:uncharacterized protein n=1 Tax=Rutidosis leptorrhynchoides TaxID=125765 RepID=UPI003A99BF91
MQKYLKLLQESAMRFEHFKLAQVPMRQNKKADVLNKLVVLTFSHFQKQVWVEELPHKSIDNDLMVVSVGEEQPNWMEPILQYIHNYVLPNDKCEARLVRERAPMYIIQNNSLYRESYCGPMIQCVGPIEAEMIVDEVHNGSCALHSGYKIIAAKIMRMGYFWPSLYRDVAKIVKRFKSCQRHAPQNRMPRHDMIPVNSSWPFHKWAIDIVGPFPAGEWVLRNNDASRAEKLGKLGPNWEGPYQVVAINAAGSYKLTDIEGRNLPNVWHAALL